MVWNHLGNSARRVCSRAGTRRAYGTQQTTSASSKHSSWYRDMIPGMIPIALLGSSVYLGLQLARAKFSHEKQLVEAQERVAHLEARLKHLESQIENVSVETIVLEEKPTRKSRWW
ncbi:hypothetical protein BJ322DRAFT_1013100 [Thelephora terrestris]|uniref:Uncharacterized protein n=1 Tax=Thelephora terrestris TaxID=56493 RepID=A0A9P6L1Q7_9AGAM|nr:hypothetical protein BJ322DRAFT_1013100 [Thelephora terrestris]